MNLFFNTEQNKIRLPYRFLILFLLILSYLFLWVGFLTLGLIFFGLMFGLFSMSDLPGQLERLLQSAIWVDLVLAIVLFLSVRQGIVFSRKKLDKEEPSPILLHENWQFFWIGMASIFILFAIVILFNQFHIYSIQYNYSKPQTTGITTYFILLFSSIFTVSARQLLYWQYIYTNLKQVKYGFGLTILLLAILDSNHQPCQVFYAIWLNLLLAGFFILSDKIGLPVGIASAWNLFFYHLFSFPIAQNPSAPFQLNTLIKDPLALANRVPLCSYLPMIYLFFLSIIFLYYYKLKSNQLFWQKT